MNWLNFHTHRLAHIGETALCSCSPDEFPERLRARAAGGACVAVPVKGPVPEQAADTATGVDGAGVTFFSLGIHPWYAAAAVAADWECLHRNAGLSAVLAVGEAGMDACRAVPLEVQRAAFRRQAVLAEEVRKPLLVHCVHMADEVLAVRRAIGARQPWIWHGFRGKPQQMEQLLRHGFYFSFGSRRRDDSLTACPADRLLLETDDKDVGIRQVYEDVAALRGLSLQVLLGQMQANFRALFAKAGL